MRLAFATILFCIYSGLNAQTTYIQVISEAGISVFLNGTFVGKTTSDLGGLIIENVTPGNCVIKVIKDGFNPQEETIMVKKGEVLTYKVKPFASAIRITQSGNIEQQEINLKVGTIKIQSVPVSININIPELGINSSKFKDEWEAVAIPEGKYNAIFSWDSKSLKSIIEVKNNQITHLFVNIMNSVIDDRSAEANQAIIDKKVNILTDPRDQKTYKIFKIEGKTWMLENLDYVTYESWVYDDDPANSKKYGRLYNWPTAQSVCPSGWHLPSVDEWKLIEDKRFKSTTEYKYDNRLSHDYKSIQDYFDGGGGKRSGASLLSRPSYFSGNFQITEYWTSTDKGNAKRAIAIRIEGIDDGAIFYFPSTPEYYKDEGHYVRCVKD